MGCFLDHLPFAGKPANFVFVAAQRQPLVQGAGDLPFQFAHAPLVLGRLDLVEGALFAMYRPSSQLRVTR